MPDITRMFRGPLNDFEVEVVFGGVEDTSPYEAHTYEEYVFLAEGEIVVTRDDRDEPETFTGPAYLHVPIGVMHSFDLRKDPTRLVVIHPARNDGGV
jgi:quercetin dioxygenase-like cupin family protein